MKTLHMICCTLIFALCSISPTMANVATDHFGREPALTTLGPTPLLLAHHFGNRPDWLDDPENVHGGDYSDWEDPNGDNPPEPGEQPDEDPSNGDSGIQPDNDTGRQGGSVDTDQRG